MDILVILYIIAVIIWCLYVSYDIGPNASMDYVLYISVINMLLCPLMMLIRFVKYLKN